MYTLAAATVLVSIVHAEELMIYSFDFASVEAAQQACTLYGDTPPVSLIERDGGTALRIDCPFSQEMERAACDLSLNVDLSRYGRFSLDYYVDDPRPLRNFTLYFRSPGGWYGASFQGQKGWNHIELLRTDFRSEDSPAGWHQIDGLRLSQWKGAEGDTHIGIDNLKAYSADIAVILSTRSQAIAETEARSVEVFAIQMQRMLAATGITTDYLTDEDVIGGALSTRRVAIFPYAPSQDAEVIAKTREFVEGGGKVFLFYSLDPAMAEILGVRTVGWRQADQTAPFASVVFDAEGISGLPAAIQQNSWNANLAEPARQDARVIGWWQNGAGERSNEAAIILSDTGLYMGHVLTQTDAENKGRMMTALLGLFIPEVWERKAEHTLAQATQIGPFRTLDELKAHVAEFGPEPQAVLDKGERLLIAAQQAVEAGKHAEGCELAIQARELLRQAYLQSHRGRGGEFRALWEHSGTGPFPEEGWGKSLDLIKTAGFNAIVPNLWWAGLAYYNSEYLPVAEKVRIYGDQVAECVEEAHKRGIEVHAWKVNWNLGNAPKEFVEKLRAAGRTMMDVKGNPVDWLCPSHPDNYQLELDTMLEVARKYDVDGIHFDYIRYRDESVCYCEGCRERFQRDTGLQVENWPEDCYSGPLKQAYRDWRCEQITRLVRATAQQARKEKPYLKISAAVFSTYPETKTSIGQDWLLWVKEGYLDFVCPMNYTADNDWFRRIVARQVALIGGQCPLYPGIGASAPGQPVDQTVAQVEIAREIGADGFTVFQLGQDTAPNHVPAMGLALLKPPTYTPNIAPHLNFNIPGEPDPGLGLVPLPRGKTLECTVSLDSLGTYRKTARQATGQIELQTTTGTTLKKLGSMPQQRGESVSLHVESQEGRLRLAVTGELEFEDGTVVPFVVRSMPFAFIAE